MSAPVWVLSVDLQTKTATFQSGMADAAKSARTSFSEIKSGSESMGQTVGSSTGAARQGVMLLGTEFGVHLPRGLTTFISSLGPVGAAMEAAFPFVAIAVGATLLLQHLAKLKEEGQKLTQDQMSFGTAAQNAFNALDQKILGSQMKADELRNNHLGALRKELEMIDRTSMAELAQQFGVLAKEADTVFADLQSHWYTFGIGSSGAKHALDEFKSKYDSLLAQGKSGEAADLLKGTKESAEKVLALQNQAKGSSGNAAGPGGNPKLLEHEAALNGLKAAGVGFTDKEVEAQQTLVEALNAQIGIQGKIGELKKGESGNANLGEQVRAAAEASAAARAAAESKMRIAELSLQSDRATATARDSVLRASIQQREATEMEFAQRELQIQLAGNAAQIAALDKMAKDYPNALKALHNKAEELTAQHAAKVAEITAKATVEQAAKDLQDLEQGEREKIEATREGSAERVAAIDAAISEEQAKNLQDTNYYRELMNLRIATVRKAAEEEAKVRADVAREMADSDQKMGELALAAQKEQQALQNSAHRITIQQRMAEDIKNANDEYALKLTAGAHEIAALDKNGKDYETKLVALQNKQKQLVQQNANEITQIKSKAEEEQNQRIQTSQQHFNDTVASGLTQTLMGHKSFASMMNSIGSQVVSGMMENAIKAIMANDMSKSSDAAKAARAAYLTGESIGGPAGVILGPVFGAAAFAAVSAFQNGTDSVPGYGYGDKVPAMLEPGEGVVPGGVMDNLRKMASSGNMGGGGSTVHLHHSPTYHVQTIDGDGIKGVLTKHSDQFSRHMTSELRKMNR